MKLDPEDIEAIRDVVREELRNTATANNMKVPDVATMTGYKPGYIYDLVRQRKIPFLKVGKSLRFSSSEVEAWLRSGRPNIQQQAIDNMAANYIVNGKQNKYQPQGEREIHFANINLSERAYSVLVECWGDEKGTRKELEEKLFVRNLLKAKNCGPKTAQNIVENLLNAGVSLKDSNKADGTRYRHYN